MMNFILRGFMALFLAGTVVSTTTVAPAQPIEETTPVTDNAVIPVEPISPDSSAYLPDQGYTLIDQELTGPLNKINKPGLKPDMFSRCGSGFYPMVDEQGPTPSNNYFTGMIRYSVGCDSGIDIAKFRITPAGDKLEVLDKVTKQYITPKAWLYNYNNSSKGF